MMFGDPKKFTLRPEDEQVLREQAIDAEHPGSLLHDLGVIFALLKKHPLSLTASEQLSGDTLKTINPLLAHPIRLALRRTPQKSYPPVMGLYLLMRATGLTYIERTETKAWLHLNDAVFPQWESMNPTEQYCNLLETWLTRASAETIGETDGLASNPLESLIYASKLLALIPEQGLMRNDKQNKPDVMAYIPGWIIGLMTAFGLITIQDSEPAPGKGWQIEAIRWTAFGRALVTLLAIQIEAYFEKPDEHVWVGLDFDAPIGVLQPMLQPYFPQWNKNLVLPETKSPPGTYIFKVSLGNIWRRIAIGSQQKMDALAQIILDAFAFDNDHLYEFTYRNATGRTGRIQHPYMDSHFSTSKVKVGDLPIAIGQTMTFVFDFGDYWEFDMLLERIDTDKKLGQPAILETKGEAPKQYPDSDESDGEEEV